MSEQRKETGKEQARERLERLMVSVGKAILGKDREVRLAVTALLARGHLLIEDIPGVGKTTLAHALARSISCSFKRIQFTSDLLPSDILGVKVWEPAAGGFRFLPGPIFNSIVLADEINRATPRTQSALLEAMNDCQVTIEGETYPLPSPFMVIATQNPVEHHGTYPLPDSQLDRFLISMSLGYPGREEEKRILKNQYARVDSPGFTPVMEGEEVSLLQREAERVKMAPEIIDYLLALVERTRSHPGLKLGASPRGTIALATAAKAWALVHGRDFTLPDDVKQMAEPALAHRLLPRGGGGPEEKKRAVREILEEILETVPPPL